MTLAQYSGCECQEVDLAEPHITIATINVSMATTDKLEKIFSQVQWHQRAHIRHALLVPAGGSALFALNCSKLIQAIYGLNWIKHLPPLRCEWCL